MFYFVLFCDIMLFMKDTELSKLINIPITTIRDWKKTDNDNYRKLIYELLKGYNKEELEKRIDAIKLIKGIK